MAIPHGRKIMVDERHYEWIVKQEKHASRYEEDDIPMHDKVVTIRVDEDGGKLTQHKLNRSTITPEFVAELIRADVIRGVL